MAGTEVRENWKTLEEVEPKGGDILSLYSIMTHCKIMKLLQAFFVTLGIFLQINEYIANRSLWIDEASVANNILSYNLTDLLAKGKNFGYPLGFTITEKIVTCILGGSEFALRLFPLVCGILATILFPKIINRIADINTTTIATALFSSAFKLIYYASETKPYTLDILATLVIWNMLIDGHKNGLVTRQLPKYILMGWTAFFFSTRSAIMLIGGGMGLLIKFLHEKRTASLKPLILLNVGWLFAFLLYYILILRNFIHAHDLNAWNSVYPSPPPFFSIGSAQWLAVESLRLLLFPLHYEPVLAQFLFIGGIIFLLNKDWKISLTLIMPIALTIILAFGGHPLYDRLLLFLMPLLIFIIASGIGAILLLSFTLKTKTVLTFVCLFVLLKFSLQTTILQAVERYSHEEIKPVLEFIQENRQPSDAIYLYYGSLPAFQYYADRYHFENIEIIKGVSSRADPTQYLKDIELMKRYRGVWVLFTHIYQGEALFILDNIEKWGGKPGKSFFMNPNPYSTPFNGKAFVCFFEFSGGGH